MSSRSSASSPDIDALARGLRAGHRAALARAITLIETVGIGQSETAVCDMTDFFLALMLPGGGDELQGIKKGLVELADMIAINKADGDNLKRANITAADYRG